MPSSGNVQVKQSFGVKVILALSSNHIFLQCTEVSKNAIVSTKNIFILLLLRDDCQTITSVTKAIWDFANESSLLKLSCHWKEDGGMRGASILKIISTEYIKNISFPRCFFTLDCWLQTFPSEGQIHSTEFLFISITSHKTRLQCWGKLLPSHGRVHGMSFVVKVHGPPLVSHWRAGTCTTPSRVSS